MDLTQSGGHAGDIVRGGQQNRITAVLQQAGHVVVGLSRGDHRDMFCHGFEQHHGEHILRGRMGQAVHGCISAWHIAQYAHETAAFTRTQRGHQITVLAGLRGFANDHDLQVKVQQGGCFEQRAQALFLKS